MNKYILVITVFFGLMSLAGCATSEKIQVTQRGDNDLTCKQLDAEFNKLDKAQAEVESKKGVNETNVAAVLVWLPGLAYTYYDAAQATQAIADRRSKLTAIYNARHCHLPGASAESSTNK